MVGDSFFLCADIFQKFGVLREVVKSRKKILAEKFLQFGFPFVGGWGWSGSFDFSALDCNCKWCNPTDILECFGHEIYWPRFVVCSA